MIRWVRDTDSLRASRSLQAQWLEAVAGAPLLMAYRRLAHLDLPEVVTVSRALHAQGYHVGRDGSLYYSLQVPLAGWSLRAPQDGPQAY